MTGNWHLEWGRFPKGLSPCGIRGGYLQAISIRTTPTSALVLVETKHFDSSSGLGKGEVVPEMGSRPLKRGWFYEDLSFTCGVHTSAPCREDQVQV